MSSADQSSASHTDPAPRCGSPCARAAASDRAMRTSTRRSPVQKQRVKTRRTRPTRYRPQRVHVARATVSRKRVSSWKSTRPHAEPTPTVAPRLASSAATSSWRRGGYALSVLLWQDGARRADTFGSSLSVIRSSARISVGLASARSVGTPPKTKNTRSSGAPGGIDGARRAADTLTPVCERG